MATTTALTWVKSSSKDRYPDYRRTVLDAVQVHKSFVFCKFSASTGCTNAVPWRIMYGAPYRTGTLRRLVWSSVRYG